MLCYIGSDGNTTSPAQVVEKNPIFHHFLVLTHHNRLPYRWTIQSLHD